MRAELGGHEETSWTDRIGVTVHPASLGRLVAECQHLQKDLAVLEFGQRPPFQAERLGLDLANWGIGEDDGVRGLGDWGSHAASRGLQQSEDARGLLGCVIYRCMLFKTGELYIPQQWAPLAIHLARTGSWTGTT
jgi:hypothetical protein